MNNPLKRLELALTIAVAQGDVPAIQVALRAIHNQIEALVAQDTSTDHDQVIAA
jgi:hypothetical protein